MSIDDGGLDRLRAMLAASAVSAAPTGDCPTPDQIWAALDGDLSGPEVEALAGHLAGCAGCREAWQLARRVAGENGEVRPIDRAERPAFRRRWRPLLAGMAAAALLVVGLGVIVKTRTQRVEYREPEQGEITSLVGPDVALPHSHCLLRWSPGPDGSQYKVDVATESLEVIATSDIIDTPEYLVPPETLARLPAGAKLVWQVELMDPEGTVTLSPVFVNYLE
jgi:hypothetical protein